MFLRKFLYKPSCEICSLPLEKLRVFCKTCQSDLYYKLIDIQSYVEIKNHYLLLHWKKNLYLKRLYQLIQSPRNSFLIENFSSLISFALCLEEMPQVEAIVKTSFFPKKKDNRVFLKQLRKSANLEVIDNCFAEKNDMQLIFALSSSS